MVQVKEHVENINHVDFEKRGRTLTPSSPTAGGEGEAHKKTQETRLTVADHLVNLLRANIAALIEVAGSGGLKEWQYGELEKLFLSAAEYFEKVREAQAEVARKKVV